MRNAVEIALRWILPWSAIGLLISSATRSWYERTGSVANNECGTAAQVAWILALLLQLAALFLTFLKPEEERLGRLYVWQWQMGAWFGSTLPLIVLVSAVDEYTCGSIVPRVVGVGWFTALLSAICALVMGLSMLKRHMQRTSENNRTMVAV